MKKGVIWDSWTGGTDEDRDSESDEEEEKVPARKQDRRTRKAKRSKPVPTSTAQFEWEEKRAEQSLPKPATIAGLKSFKSVDNFSISGRGTVWNVKKPAGMKLPERGEHVYLDGREVRVRSVERHPLPEDEKREEMIGLLVAELHPLG